MGTFAGAAAQIRSGGFGDIDRETVTTHENGIERVRVASHRNLERLLVDAGLTPEVAAADVDALHHGRVLVLSR
jgi:Mn-dependent DtxR family transcriptional regulator